jgi:hypothetical protein
VARPSVPLGAECSTCPMDPHSRNRTLLLLFFCIAGCGGAAMNTATAGTPVPVALAMQPVSHAVIVVPRVDPIMSDAAIQHFDLPALGTDEPRSLFKSDSEQFVRRVRSEGLPIARMWENDFALVSLGLNPKGQAGLWLLQKRKAAADSSVSPRLLKEVVAVSGSNLDADMRATADERQRDLRADRAETPDAAVKPPER